MTDLDTKLDRIVAALKASLELAEKSTPGPWNTGGIFNPDSEFAFQYIYPPGTNPTPLALNIPVNDAAFIVHARTMCQSMAKALLEVLLWMRDAADFCANGEPANMTAKHLLFIADTFTEDML